MRIVAMSDVHGKWDRITVPDGDLLVLAGDLCEDMAEEYSRANDWIASLPHHHKLYVPGNHDPLGIADQTVFPAAHILVDQRAQLHSLVVYGAPWPSQGRENYERLIPPNVDVLITHEPPLGIRDWTWSSKFRLGNRDLLNAVRAARPRVHIFGHCHDAHGHETHDGTLFANVAVCNRQFQATHEPTVIDVTANNLTIVQ